MAKYSNMVEYNIKTNLDASGITKLRSELNKLNQEVTTVGKTQWGLKDSEIQRTVAQVNRLQTAITECFNPKTGILDLSKFNQVLTQEKTLLGTINADWTKLGAQGTRAINSLASSVLTLNKDAITMNSTLSKIANTFSNTVRWGITASIFQEMMSSVQGAVSYMKDLDESLTQIQMVTGSSKEDMRELAQYANNAAQALGSTTTDYTNAVKVFVQEGFSESESKQYADLSTKLANVSEQSTSVTSDQITAYRNAFQLDYEQTVAAMDKVASVANNTASNVNELMTASQRAASVAQAVGASQDSFLAAIATIESVTRQSAEEIGNGLKTIYQRFADIKVGSTEDGVDYGQYAAALKQVGVDVLDASGQFKGMDQILSELQEVWSSLDDTMKIAVGEKVAGKFQYNRFAALMNNADYYQKALAATGAGSQGMMDQMNEAYLDSIEGRLKTFQAAGEQVMSTLFNQDTVEPIIGAATDFLNIINNIIETLGGGLPIFEALSAIILKTFSSQIGEQIARITTNIQTSAQATTNAGLMDTALGNIQERTGQKGGAIGEIRSVLQGEDFAGLSDTTQEKILASAKQLLEAENKVADVKDQQQLLQQQINKDLANNSELADVILAEDKAQYELGVKQLKQAQDKFDAELASGDLSEEEIEYRESELEAAEKAVEADRIRYEQTQARVKLGEQLDNYTLEELIALDKRNAELDQATNYAERYLEYTQAASVAEGELTAASSQLKGIKEQVDTEKIATSVTNLISGLTSVLFLTQSVVSLWQLWTNEDATFEDKVIGTISSLAIILPTAVTAWQALVAVKWADVTAGAASVAMAGKDIVIKGLQTVANSTLAGSLGIATAAQWALNIAMEANPIGLVIAAIAALIVIITSLVTLYGNWQNSLHSANKEFEKQKELLSELKNGYDEVSESVNTLKNSIDSIADKKSALEDLEEGTLEWKEAVVALNQEIVNLLQTYPELAKYVTSDNGVLNIEEDKLDEFYEAQLDRVRSAQNMITIQQARTYDASSQAAIENFVNQNSDYPGDLTKSDVKEVIDGLNNGAIKDVSEACEKLGLDVDENGEALITLKDTIDTNTIATDALNATLGSEAEANYQSFASDPDSSKAYDAAYDALTEQFGSALTGWDSTIASLTDNRFKIANSDEFKEVVKGALPDLEGDITSIREASDSFDWVIKTTTGEEIQIRKQDLHERMALYQAEQDIEREKLELDKEIYEALGATYNEELKDFEFGEGSFQPNEQQLQLIKDYQDNTQMMINGEMQGFADYMKEQGIPSVVDFATALKDTNGALFEFNQELSNIQGATSLSDLEYEYAKSDHTTADTEDYNLKLEELTQEAAEMYDIDLDDIIDQAKAFREELELTEGAARDLAIQNQRMTKGIDALYDGWEKWSDVLANSDHTAKDYIDATQEATAAIADLVGASQDLELSNDFFESAKNLELIQKAAEGDIEAINELGIAVGRDLVEQMEAISWQDFVNSANTEQTYADMVDQFYDAKNTVLSGIDELQANLNNLGIGENVYDILGGADWVNALNIMAEQTHMSVEQMNSLLNSIGVQADVTTIDVPQKVKVPVYTTRETVKELPSKGGISAFEKTSYTVQTGTEEVDGVISVAQINTGQNAGTPPSITYVGNGPVSRSSTPVGRSVGKGGGGSGGKGKSPKSGGGSSNKDTKPKDKIKNEWDYLTDITNDLDRAAAIIEKLSKLEDRLYGPNRVSQLKKLQNEYKNYIKLLQQEVKLAENHAKRLRDNAYDENGNLTMNGYAYRAGVGKLQFDAQGNLDNGQDIERALTNRVNRAISDYNAHRNANDASYYEERVTLAQQDRDGFLKALSDYESTLSKIEEGQSQIQDYKEKIQDAADEIVDAIQQGIEDMVQAIDNQRDFNKLYRDWMQGGSDYSHFNNQARYYSEGLNGLLSRNGEIDSVFNMELQSLKDRITEAKQVFNKTGNADDKKYSEQAAYENLQEATGNLTKTLEDIIEYYDSLIETIGEASEKMDELIDSRLEAFNQIEEYLDTRLEQSKLLFGDNYQAETQFYQQKINTNLEKMVSINSAIEAKQATVKALESIEASNKELSTEERKALQEARDQVTSLQQEQIDTETKLLQDIANKLNSQVTAELEATINDLFSGKDVDWLSEQWELATRNSEQYLDDYNRAFELQKLQSKYQDLLNDAQGTSSIIQKHISEQMNEQLKYLREKNNLSKYDVEYAEKQLEILQRQIALEDARNNKSQMRLQRNAAGNYDFVYAADEDAINEATQALLASQQEAYNLSKQMYLETYESAFKAAQEIKQMVIDTATNATLSTEEQTERIKWLIDNLNQYMTGSSVELSEISVNLYNDIIEAEQLVAEENLGNLAKTFQIMREQSSSIRDAISQDSQNIKDNIVNSSVETSTVVQEQSGIMRDSVNDDLTNITDNVANTLGISLQHTSDTLQKIRQGTLDTMNGINEDILNIIGNIDDRFSLSADSTLLGVEGLENRIQIAYQNIAGDGGYLDQYREKNQETLEYTGDSYDNFIENSINAAAYQLEELIWTTEDWQNDLEILNSIINESAQEIREWKSRTDAAIESAKNFIKESNNMQSELGGLSSMTAIASSMFDNLAYSADNVGYAIQSMSHDIADAYYSIQDAANAAANAYDDMARAAGNAEYAARNAEQAAWDAKAAQDAAGIISNLTSASTRGLTSAINALQLPKNILFNPRKSTSKTPTFRYGTIRSTGFATGGYTGDWSDLGIDNEGGKLAILHQKELVLNKEDTKNMLSAVEIVRDVMSGINTMPSLGKTFKQNSIDDTIEQRVEINATFPGVTEAIEIKQALEQLADNAYQVANRYKY